MISLATEATQQESSDQLEHERRLGIFADRLFERLPSDLHDSYPRQKRLSIAASAFEFFATRIEPLQLRVRPGGADGSCVVETAMDDRPFIVDSILEFFHKHEISVRLLLHPVFHFTRANDGSIVSFEQATAGERPESFTHAEI